MRTPFSSSFFIQLKYKSSEIQKKTLHSSFRLFVIESEEISRIGFIIILCV
jgi:hypothetical protein